MNATTFSPNGSLNNSSEPGSPRKISVIDINISPASDFSELPTSDLSDPQSDNEGQELYLTPQKIPK